MYGWFSCLCLSHVGSAILRIPRGEGRANEGIFWSHEVIYITCAIDPLPGWRQGRAAGVRAADTL